MSPKSATAQVYRMASSFFRSMQSENMGGAVSMVGSCLFVLGGDTSGILVTITFLLAEVVLVKSGHTRIGYSIGCALFSFGDAMAVTAEISRDNTPFQIALSAMAATWLLGAMRAPLAWLGGSLDNMRLVQIADQFQPIASALTLALRIPGMLTALGGANYLGTAAVACWGASDILVGRLQETYRHYVGRPRQEQREVD